MSLIACQVPEGLIVLKAEGTTQTRGYSQQLPPN
jgi:hypothetical protein